MKKNAKPLLKPSREVKQKVLIVRGAWMSVFAVEGEKSDFCDS